MAIGDKLNREREIQNTRIFQRQGELEYALSGLMNAIGTMGIKIRDDVGAESLALWTRKAIERFGEVGLRLVELAQTVAEEQLKCGNVKSGS